MISSSNRRRTGFTLVEITAVILIAALIAGAVTLNTVGPRRIAEMRDVVDRVRQFDALSRAYAANTGTDIRIVVDTDLDEISRVGGRGTETRGRPLRLPGDWGVASVRVFGREPVRGRTVIPCSSAGLTPSYGLLIEGPGGRLRWLLVAGLTGETTECEDEDEIQNIYRAAIERRYAD